MDVDLPDVRAEVVDAFARYEAALMRNDLAALDAFFQDSPHTVRYGTGENLVGIDAIRRFRSARSPAGLARTLRNTLITTYGRDCATTMTEFVRPAFASEGRLDRVGRQSQTWMRLADGWRVVAAHVSVLPLAEPEPILSPAPSEAFINPEEEP